MPGTAYEAGPQNQSLLGDAKKNLCPAKNRTTVVQLVAGP
jgi:hypothetical protein